MSNAIITWIEARAQEPSTWTGLIGFVATAVFHHALATTDVGTLALIAAGLVSGGLIAVTTKNPAPLVETVIADIPNAIVVAGDLKSQAHEALAAGEPAKYSALMEQHNAANGTVQ